MSEKYRLTPRARADLDAIADYTLATWGEDQMTVYVRAVIARFAWLADNPKIGRERPEIAPGLRSYREGSHLIFYRIRANRLEIIGLPHQAMDLDTYL